LKTIDLYYQHRVDPATLSRKQGAMAQLVQGRKDPSHWSFRGVATDATPRGEVHPIAALQTEYSLWSREPEDEKFSQRAANSASDSSLTALSDVASSPASSLD